MSVNTEADETQMKRESPSIHGGDADGVNDGGVNSPPGPEMAFALMKRKGRGNGPVLADNWQFFAHRNQGCVLCVRHHFSLFKLCQYEALTFS